MYLNNEKWVPGVPAGHRIVGPKDSYQVPRKNKPIVLYRSHGGIGDSLLLPAIAREIKRQTPGKQVIISLDTLYANGDLRDCTFYNDDISQVIDYRAIKRSDFKNFKDITDRCLKEEVFARLTTNWTPMPVMIDIFCEDAGVKVKDQNRRPIYIMTEEEKAWGKRYLEHLGIKHPIIALSTESTDPKRKWPAENAIQFIVQAISQNFSVLHFTWHEEPSWIRPNYYHIHRWRLRAAATLLKQCDVLVSTDSALLHLGEALNIKTIGMFSKIPPECRIKYYKHVTPIYHNELLCAGCGQLACPNEVLCMKIISAREVMQVVRSKTHEDSNPLRHTL